MMELPLDTIYPILIGTFSWSTLYFTLCLVNPRRSYEWNIRVVTLLHGIVVTLLGAYSIYVGPWPFTHSGGASTSYQTFVISVSLSYFLLDFSWCLYHTSEGPVMLLHHTLSIFGMSWCYIAQWWGTEIVVTIFGAEITNPLLQARWFLKAAGKYDSVLGDIVDVAFMSVFGLFRIGIGSYLLFSYYQQDTDFLGRLGGTLIYSVGWLFWISIVQYGMKRYRRRYGGKRPVSHMDAKSNGTKASEGSPEVNGNIIGSGEEKAQTNGNLHKRHLNGFVQTNGVSENTVQE